MSSHVWTEEERKKHSAEMKEKRRRWKAKGLCEKCGKRPAVEGITFCAECREKRRAYQKKAYRSRTFEERLKRAEQTRERRKKRVESGLCSECGKRPSADGSTRCAECLAKERDYQERNKDRRRENKQNLRADRKARGICIQCGCRDARPGSVRCVDCLELQKESQAKTRRKRTAAQREAKRRRDRAGKQRLRMERERNGVCILCGKRPATDGYLSCPVCRAKERIRRRKSGVIPRGEWPDHGLCYICGKNPLGRNPDGDLMKVCVECRERIVKKTVNSPSEANRKNHENYAKMCRNDFRRAFMRK